MLGAEIAERRADPREDILSLLVDRPLRGRRADGRPGDPRPADDAAAGRARDDRDRPRVDVRPAAAPPARRSSAWSPRSTPARSAYVRAVVAESLRLRPVVPLAGRRLSQELRVDGHVLPPGTDVTPAIWLTHTRPDRYPEPYAFRPERFLDERAGDLRVGPVRRRRAALPRRGVRGDRDARRARGDPAAARRCGRPRDAAERVARRNVTFSPRTGTQTIASPR